MELLDQVRKTIARHALASAGTRVIVALSGGPDSVALAHVLRSLAEAGELELVGLAHLNHQLRDAAAEDARFCQDLARDLDLPLALEQADVGAHARRERRSVEDAAHELRYEFLSRARAHFRADCVALGHTRDDQAETFLLRLMRGAGPRGLGGMYPRNGYIVRPLLGCRRADLGKWLSDRTLPFVQDETNGDVGIPRNRVRAELVPLLETRFNPGIVDVLADEADLAREAWLWMDAMAGDLAARLVRPIVSQGSELMYEMDVTELVALPLALRRAVLWRTMTSVAGLRPISFGHVDAAIRLTDQMGDGRIDVPGQRVDRIGPRLVLTGRSGDAGGRPIAKETNLFRYPLSIPGEVALPEAGYLISAEALAADAPSEHVSAMMRNDGPGVVGSQVAIVRGDLCVGSLAVRNRRPGDRFRPIGLDGRKKLQDFFVDRKVARATRDAVPIVVDEMDRIVWVAGYGIDEAFRVTDPAQAVLILKLKALGGSA
jgi:tRNA(Ile)-lysidine synthase